MSFGLMKACNVPVVLGQSAFAEKVSLQAMT